MRFQARGLPGFVGTFGVFFRQPVRRATFFAAMAKQRFYGIQRGKGGYRGVTTTWAKCQPLITGVKNARFKSFATFEEAQAFATGDPNPPHWAAGKKTRAQARAEAASPRQFSVLQKKPPKGLFTVFTDGACGKNGQAGATAGYGVFFGVDHPENVSERLPGHPTNQRAEMMAVISAMKVAFDKELVSPKQGLLVMTDSRYTQNGMERWMHNWKKRNWKTAAQTEVKNRDLWERLDEWQTKYFSAGIQFKIEWVKGHSGFPGNEAADRLAVAGQFKSVSAPPSDSPSAAPEE